MRLTPSSAPSAGVSGGPPIEILHLFFVFSTCTRGGSDRSHPSLLTDDYYFELPAHAQVARRLLRRRSRRAAAHRRATRRLLARSLPQVSRRHPWLRGRRCWRPADATRTGAAAAGAVPGSGTIDSGAEAHSTDDCNRLTNVKPCNEIFGGANGQLTRCQKMGDMPLIAKSSSGELVRFSITNVRCVPAFTYTLLSFRQLWREQRIGSRFEDKDYLKLPADNVTVPYDRSMTLPTVVAISGTKLGSSSKL